MNIANLFHVDYWFGHPLVAQGLALWLLLSTFLVFIVAGLICKITAQFQEQKFKKIILKKIGSLTLTLGFLGMVWMFFRQEGLVFLAWRFWLLVWLAILVWWLTAIVKYITKRVPNMQSEEERRARIEKYLPKSNK